MPNATSLPPYAGTPYASALFVLGALLTVFAGAMLLPSFVAVGEGQRGPALAFAAASLAGAFIGGSLMFAMQGAQRPAFMRQNVALLAMAWVAVPFFCAGPLWASGLFPSYVSAVFEATSALTTTGASLLGDIDPAPRAFLLWRAELQWLGGYASLIMAATVLSALGTGGLDVQRTLLPLGDTGPLYERFMHIAKGLGALYLGATMAAFLAIWAGGVAAFDAFCLALSGLSTGGLLTRNDGMAPFHAPVSELFLMLAMLYGAMNFTVHWSFWRGGARFRAYGREPEFWLLLALCGLMFLLLAASEVQVHDPAHSLKGIFFLVFNAVSLATTTGFWLGPRPEVSPAFIVGALSLTLIGGASISTAGGIKLMRAWLLLSQSRVELRRLAFPRSLIRIRFRGENLETGLITGVWALFVAYLAVLALGALGLGIYGVDLLSAMIAVTATLSNAGPLFDLLHGAPGGFAGLPRDCYWLLCLLMIAGRLEVLALLSLFNPAFWRR